MSATVRDLGVLLRWRARLLLRSGLTRYTRSARKAAPARLIVGAVVALWFIGFVLLPVTAALSSSFSGSSGRRQLTPVLAWGTSATSAVIFFYAVLSLVGTLTYRNDLRLLLLTPISSRLIMGTKILSVSLIFSGIVLVSVPGLIAAGQGLHLGAAYMVAVLLAVLVVPIGPVSLATLLVLAILRWIPPARARAITTILGVSLGGLFYIGTQILAQSSARGTTRTFSASALPIWLPSVWPGRALAAIGLGETGQAVEFSLGSLLLAAGLYALAVEVAARVFATGSASYAEIKRRRRMAAHEPRIADRSGPPARISWWPIVRKDWISLRRDPQQLAPMFYPLLIIGFYLYRLLVSHSFPGASAGTSLTFRAASLYCMLAFASILLSTQLAAPVINRESRSLYLLALAPLRSRDIFLAKWLFSITPALLITELILIGGVVVLGAQAGQALLAAGILAALTVTLGGLVITVNLIWPRFVWDNPRRQVSGLANALSFAVELVVAILSCGLLILAIAAWPRSRWLAAGAVSALVVVLGGLSALVWIAGPRRLEALLGSDRLPR
jgi:ABC-2 type transport system permease protein